MVQKNLGFVDKPAKRRAVNDAVTVALKFGTRGGRTLKKPPPTREGRITSEWGQHHAEQQRAIT
jgi:hypothetical protein